MQSRSELVIIDARPWLHTRVAVRTAHQPIPRERLQHLARRVHRLGERPLFELLAELDAGADLGERLERYAVLPADFIKAFGGDVLPIARPCDD